MSVKDALVVFTPSGRRGRFPVGTPVLQAARSLGVDIDSVCGGRGICGRCQVLVSEGEFAKHGLVSRAENLTSFGAVEQEYCATQTLEAGRRLSCSAQLLGDVVMNPGTYLTARQLSLLASVGKGSVLVHPKPRVVVLSTGSELVEPGTQLRKGLITDSNSYLLVAAAQEAGAVAFRVPPVIDDEGVFMSTLEDQLHFADLIITTGGVSMGAYDTVKAVLSRLGTVTFAKVAMNPGMPQGYGRIGPNATPIITLPGNPVSAYVSFETFVRPVIRTMQGRQDIYRPYVQAVCEVELVSPPAKRQFVRAKFGGADKATVTPVRGQGSHAVGGLSQADCFIVIPAGQAAVAAGTTVDVIDLRNW